MSTLRTFNLQNPDSGTVNIEMDQGGNTLMTGIATVRGAAHFTSTSGSDAVGIGTDITAYKLDVRVTGAEAGLRVYNPDTSSNASGILRLGNDDNQNAAFLRLNSSNNTSAVGGAGSLVLGHGLSKDLHLSTAGVSRLRITSGGDLAVGATGDVYGPARLNVRPNNRDTQFSASDGNTWHDIVVKQNDTNSSGGNAVGLAFEISTGGWHANAGTGIAAIKDSNSSDYGSHLAFITRPHAAVAEERLRITSDGKVGINDATPVTKLVIRDTLQAAANNHYSFIVKGDDNGTNEESAYIFLSAIDAFTRGVAIGAVRKSSSNNHDLIFKTSGAGATPTEKLRIDSTGSIFAGGSIITEADMNWGHDSYQRPHIFTGATGGNPSDGCIVLASPETNPGGTRIGSIVFGCKTSSTSGVNNSGIKATIECNTNNNVSDAWKTGASMTFKTRPNNGNITAAQTIHHNGNITKPLQPAFRALTTGFSKNNNWQKITFGTENYDIGGNYDHANNKFTAPVAGRYVFYAGGWSSSTSADSRYAFCARVNGGGLHYLAGAHYGNVDSPMAGYYVIHNLAANDYVEMWGYSAVATTWGGGSHYMFWGGYLLG